MAFGSSARAKIAFGAQVNFFLRYSDYACLDTTEAGYSQIATGD